jgi:uncharacterized damage-inducible protein DinB
MTPWSWQDALRSAWQINNRVTVYLIESLPDEVWKARVPGVPTRTVRAIASHLHNNRCSWIRSTGGKLGVAPPKRLAKTSTSKRQVATALARSGERMLAMIDGALDQGGRIPPAAWQNFPSDVLHFLSYHVSHEGHHRGQIVMVARQLGYRLPTEVTNGLWQWKLRAREVQDRGKASPPRTPRARRRA